MDRLAVLALAMTACGRVDFSDVDCQGIDLDNDPQNCGVCHHDCLLGGCTAGHCQPVALATDQGKLRGILTDANYVYYAGPNAIQRVPKTGGTVEQIATFNGTGFRMIAFAGYLYWDTRDTGLVARAAMVPGSATETIATDQGDAGGIATDGTTVYWNNYPTAGHIFRGTVGGPSSQLLDTPTDNLTAMTLVGTTLYYMQDAIGVCRIDTAGGAPTTIAAGVGSWEMAMDGDEIYVANGTKDRIVRVSISDGTVTELGFAEDPWGIVIDPTSVYFANETGNTIARVSRAGGDMEVLATATQPVGIAVDDRAVYWTTYAGDVMVLAK